MSVQLVNGHVLLPDPFRGPAEWAREWEVETAEAVTGSQDRGGWRPEPRPRLVFSGMPVTMLQSHRFEERIRAALKSGKCALPYRGFAERITGSAMLGGTAVNVLPPVWKFAAGDYIFLQRHSDPDVFEPGQIDSLDLGRNLTLTAPLANSYGGSDAFCWPLIFGMLRLEDGAAPTSWRLGAKLVFESDRLRLRTAPMAPANFSLVNDAGEVNLGWHITTGDWEETTIERSMDGGAYEVVGEVDPAVTSYVDQPEPGHTWCYRVRVRNCVGYSAYTTQICVTISAGGGGEDDLPQLASALIWLDAADAPASVDTWTDKSGNGNNAYQSFADYRPAKLAATLNGLPVVHFDATHDVLYLPDRAYDFSLGLTIFVVYRMESAHGYRILFMLDDDHPNPYTIQLTGGDATTIGAYNAKALGTPIVGSAPLANFASGSYQLVTITHSPSERKYYLDGVLGNTVGAASAPGNTSRRFNYLGAKAGTAGPHNQLWLAELVVLNRALNDTDRALWEAWLMTKYAL